MGSHVNDESPLSSSAFRFRGQYCLVTYPRTPPEFDPWEISDGFTRFEAESIVARETHADGGLHYHAYVDFGTKRDIRDAGRKFNFPGTGCNIIPHDKTRGSPAGGYDYACKDGDIVAGGLSRESLPGVGNTIQSDKWIGCRNATTREEFLQEFGRVDFAKLCCSFGQISKYLDWRFRPVRAPYANPPGLLPLWDKWRAVFWWWQENLELWRGGGRYVSFTYGCAEPPGLRPDLRGHPPHDPLVRGSITGTLG